ncbi:hypothetical protein BB987_07060 [Photorhabdus temperata]|uniref:Chromosome segregation ATPase n=1 Tax=Photorhabdus khanii NC19 TaxID=1004151 RepID=W3VAJ9_9GAMM|nr:hypothetical protein [Photorhabdus khanii]ETS32966.1 hypothetical protein PTE_00110 [Photorhabdus khanii NC19]OHV55952.1 hypothetical protein BB987_07060 [Photorhabdus temperata]
MWLIKRVYMDGAGHEEAFYKDLTLDYIGLSQAVDSPAIEGQSSPVRNAKVVTSTYQQLVNGGGKSTYIALLLSIFEPSVSDFTQYLANRRQSEYHYRNYFYKELSVILVEMVNESGQTLLLGHAHQRNGDDVDCTLFICDAPDSLLGAPFDEVPSYSRAERNSALRSYANSLHSFESWLNLKAGSEGGMHWRKTTRQNEWRAFLLEQQINVDLIKTMVTFNSEEGGLTRFIEYKTEHDFLGAFFACTMSKDTAERLRELVAHEVERQGELEDIRRNESFLKDVLANWQAFLEPAKQLESTQAQQQLLDDGFREAMRDLTAFIGEAQIEQMQLEDDTGSLQKHIDQAVSLRELLGKRRALLEYDLVLHQLNKQKAMVDALKGEADVNQRQIEITRTAIDYKSYAKALDEYRQADEDLKVFQSETEKPLQVIFERTAGEALGVLEWAIDRHRQQEAKLEEELGQIGKDSNVLRQSYDQVQKTLGGLEADRRIYQGDKRQGESQRDELCEVGLIQKGETPAAALYRLELTLRDAQQSEEQANTAHHQKEQELEAQQHVVREMSVEQSKAHQTLILAEQKHQAAVDSTLALVKTYRTLPASTQHDVDVEDTNWHSERCGLQLDKVLHADTQTLNGMKERLLQARHELDELKLTGHELVTKQINQALEAFYTTGIARDKLWAFPHYLASAFNDDAQRIAEVIDQNPGRYLSLVALDNATLDQVHKISEKLAWKKAPIAIYLLDEAQDLRGVTPELMQVVLSNPDKCGYGQAAYEARLQELENTVALQEASVEAAESVFKVLQSFRGDWRLHYDQYGKHWSSLIEHREQARLTLENADAALKQAEHYEQTLRDEKTDALARLNSAQQQKIQAEKAHDKLSRFVEMEWAKRETAIMKLVQLAEQIQRSEETLVSLREELERQRELAENKRAEQTYISIQISEWNNLCNEPFYSEITATEGIEGRSPKDAHEKAAQSHKQLLEATKGDQVMALKQQRKDAEQAQRDASKRLTAQPAYKVYPDAVKSVALNELALINNRIAHLNEQQKQFTQRLIAAQGTMQYMSKKCEEASKALDEDFVWEEKPIEIETIQTSLAEIVNSLHETEYQLKRQLEQKTLQLKKIENVKERLQNAKTAQAMIQPITVTSAAGLPVRILSITEYADALATQCRMYASLKETLKQQNICVATVWGRFRKRIEEESARDLDARASQEYLRQLDLITTYHEVLGDLDRVGTGITQVFEAVQDSLEQFQRSIDLAVSHLTAHLEGAIKLLKRVMSVKIPEDCPVLPGRPIIKMTDRLNDVAADLRGFASSRLQQWIARGQVPRVPNRDALTADLVQSVFGEGELEVRLLKTNVSRPQWTPVTRLEGSGGQRLTSAFLLFVTVGKVREYDTGISSAGFLLADNPLGKSNADDLMRIQTQMARAYKIQLIYLTGISDENAQSMFDNHLFLNKVQKLRRRDLVTVDKERHALWSASLVAKPKSEPVF